MRLWYRRLGVRVNCGGLRNRSWTSLCACFSVRPLRGVKGRKAEINIRISVYLRVVYIYLHEKLNSNSLGGGEKLLIRCINIRLVT